MSTYTACFPGFSLEAKNWCAEGGWGLALGGSWGPGAGGGSAQRCRRKPLWVGVQEAGLPPVATAGTSVRFLSLGVCGFSTEYALPHEKEASSSFLGGHKQPVRVGCARASCHHMHPEQVSYASFLGWIYPMYLQVVVPVGFNRWGDSLSALTYSQKPFCPGSLGSPSEILSAICRPQNHSVPWKLARNAQLAACPQNNWVILWVLMRYINLRTSILALRPTVWAFIWSVSSRVCSIWIIEKAS